MQSSILSFWFLFLYLCFVFCSCVLKNTFFFPSLLPTACLLSVCYCVYIYIFIYIFLTCSFLLDYFSPSLPLQAAVAANTSTVTAGVSGAPGGRPQGAPGSPSPGPASHNIPSVNEGTDWTDGCHLGKVTYLCLWRSSASLIFSFCLLSFCISFSCFSSSHLYFLFPPTPFLFIFVCFLCSHYASQFFTSPLFIPSVIYLPTFFLFLSFLGLTSPHFSFLASVLFFVPCSQCFHLRCLSSFLLCLCPCFGLQHCLFICLSVIAEFSPLSNQSAEEIDSFWFLYSNVGNSVYCNMEKFK